MSSKKPTPLAEWKWKFNSWPNLLEKLSLDDGINYFLDWRDQYEDWCRRYGMKGQFGVGNEARFHALFLLDPGLRDLLRDRFEQEEFLDLDFQTFIEELHEIFEEFDDEDQVNCDEDLEDDEDQVDENLDTDAYEADQDDEDPNEVVRITIQIPSQVRAAAAKAAHEAFGNNQADLNKKINSEVYEVRKTHAGSCGHTMAPHESADPAVFE